MAFSSAKVTIDLDEYNHLKSIESKTSQSKEDTGSEVLAVVLNAMRFGPTRPDQIFEELKRGGLVVAISREKMLSSTALKPEDIIIGRQP